MIYSSSLVTISHRIASEPGFVQRLKTMLQKGKLDTGQAISKEDAATLRGYLDHGIPIPQKSSDWDTDPGQLDTWWA